MRRRRSRAEGEGLVSAFAQSGLGRKEFCAVRGLSVHTLDAWRRRVARSGCNLTTESSEKDEANQTIRSRQTIGSNQTIRFNDKIRSHATNGANHKTGFNQAAGFNQQTESSEKNRSNRALGSNGKIVPVEIVADRATRMESAAATSAAGHGQFRIVLSHGLRIEVEPGFDAAELRCLIAALDEVATLDGRELGGGWSRPV